MHLKQSRIMLLFSIEYAMDYVTKLEEITEGE